MIDLYYVILKHFLERINCIDAHVINYLPKQDKEFLRLWCVIDAAAQISIDSRCIHCEEELLHEKSECIWAINDV